MNSIETATRFFALLAVVAQVLLVLLVAGLTVPRFRTAVQGQTGSIAPWFAVAVASVCTLGSLYLSEVAKFTPCRMCWVQRGFMYPLVLIGLLHAMRPRTGLRRLIQAMCVLGGLVSSFHVLVEYFPNLESSTCDPKNPCSIVWMREFSYVTIPVMALTGFALIFVCMLLSGSRTTSATRNTITTPTASQGAL